MYSPITGTGDGSAPVVNLTFDYISQDDIKASVDGVDVAFTWTGVSQVTFSAAVGAASTWEVRRETSIDLPLVDFTNGSVLTEQDLDLSNKQIRFHQQEVDQRVTDAASEAAAAAASEAAAATSAANASTSATNASTSATNASASATAAAASVALLKSVKDFGAVGDYNTGTGTGTDDSPAFAAAIASLGAAGGKVLVPNGMKCLIDTALNVPDNVVIEGYGNGRRGKYNNVEASLLNFAPALYVNPAVTITVNSSSGVRNLAIFRKGLAMNITAAQVAAQFTGTAITIADFATDPIIESNTILGFQYAIRTVPANTRADRVRIRWNNIDSLNGIFLENAADLSALHDNQGWPFVTAGSAAEAGSAQLLRSGTFLHIGGTINDWTAAVDNFNYGYAIGYRATDAVQSVSFLNCRADHVPGLTDGAVGFLVDGTAREIRIENAQVASKQYGIKIDSTYGSGRVAALISNPEIWAVTTAGIVASQGDVDITGGALRNSGGGSAIQTGASAGKVVVDGVDIRSFTIGMNNASSSVRLQHRNVTFFSVTTLVQNPYVPTVASGSTITLDGENEAFVVTGTTNFGTLQPVAAYAGKRVTLQFASGLTVLNGGNMKLSGAANFVATADDTISFISDGTTWREAGRSVN